ncbi:MAG: efflux RND transporter periplasmic adaptor subunit [Myxococcales bacterium]|nr:efflux RND transporter periplasmic adaptor subunit [Myxococcales bacterium]
MASHPTYARTSATRRLVTLAVLAVAAVAGWLGWQRWHGRAAPLTYTTTPLARTTLVRSVTASGTLSPVEISTVGSQVSGRVIEVLVDHNDRVTKGQVLARLDPQVLTGERAQARARLQAAQAELVRAKATAANAHVTATRTASLVASGAVSASDVDAAQAAAAVADAAVASAKASIVLAQAQVRNAETNLTYTTITAPIAGVVISRSVDPGNTVAASLQAPELFVIAGDLARMELHASVAEADVSQLADGQRVELAFDAFPDRTFAGAVRQIRNQAVTTNNVVTYDAVVSVANPDGLLRPGMTATATFVVDQAPDALVVPVKALRYRPATATMDKPARGARPSPGVWVLRDGAPVRVAVTTGLSDGTSTVITGAGLAEGDAIITADSRARAAPAAGNGGSRGGNRSSGPPGPPPMF